MIFHETKPAGTSIVEPRRNDGIRGVVWDGILDMRGPDRRTNA